MKAIRLVGVIVVLIVAIVVFKGSKTGNVDDRAKAMEVKEVSSLTKLNEATNSDGSKRLAGTSEITDVGVKYKFVTSDEKKNEKTLLFESLLNKESSVVIPYNSWSSDEKHVFLEAKTGPGKNYYVFNADGSNFKDGIKFLDVMDYWEKSGIDKRVDHVSGWAGPGLLVVYTTNLDGSDSFAYWFVVDTRRFMNVREL